MAYERRLELTKILCRRRHETIARLAFELEVSERTIRRDIDVLSFTIPIYTQCGRYGGGVYISEEYQMDWMYMKSNETELLIKIYSFFETRNEFLSENDMLSLKKLIKDFKLPKIHKGESK